MSHSELRRRLEQVSDLRAAAGLLSWDQETYMPPEGARVRGLQLATLEGLAHHLFTEPRTGELLLEAGIPGDETEAAVVRVARRDFDRATRLPTAFVEEAARARNEAHHAWLEARKRSEFATFAPHLERMMDLARRQADLLGFEEHPYDALLDEYEPGMRASEVRAVFADLRGRTLPLLRRVVAAGEVADDVLTRPFPPEAQKAFAWRVAGEAFGLQPGFARQDESAHPFQTNFSRDDVRITTRVEGYWPACLFGTWHEAGHAMYERGVSPRWERTPVSAGASLGVHESQSRLFENLLARSRPFWQRYFGALAEVAPEVTAGLDPEALYRAVNRVSPTLIRVEADEVTYNFHIMLRFELELALLEGSLRVADLPEAWNAKMGEDLGLTPPNDALGVLQDIHWSAGLIGYFPTYSLGNLLSVQLLEAARRDPGVAAGVDRAEYGPLLAWLAQNVHQHGRSLTPGQIAERATGRALTADPYVAYLHAKYGDLYGPGGGESGV